jgi:hypothetical protein
MSAPIAALLRSPSGLVACEPRMSCESCVDAETCDGSYCPEQDPGFGDPMDMRLECIRKEP